MSGGESLDSCGCWNIIIHNEMVDLFFYFSHQDASGALEIIEHNMPSEEVWHEVKDGLIKRCKGSVVT